MSASQKHPAQQRLGKFLLQGELGRGGMGVVYRGFDEALQRPVAIKVLTEAQSEASLARFRRELGVIARLRHPSIVVVHEATLLGSSPAIVMDLVTGVTLDRALAPAPGGGTPLPFVRALEVVRDAARALHFAHEQGVVHRDVKPHNLMIDDSGRVVVLDFGLAAVIDPGQSRLTRTDATVGTPAYVPPEQISASGAAPDRRSDVYGLGATLYHVLTGAAPFVAASGLELLAAVLTTDPVPPGVINPRAKGDLEAICLKCLEKDPDQRYETAAVVADELDRYLAGQPTLIRPLSGVARLGVRARRHAAAVALVLLLGGLTTWSVLRARDEELAAEAARVELAAVLARLDAAQKEAAQKEAAQKADAAGRRELVTRWLDHARAGEFERDTTLRDDALLALTPLHDPETAATLAAALDEVTRRYATGEVDAGDRAVAALACDVLGRLGAREVALPALGRYLEIELDQVRAARAVIALYRLGGPEALDLALLATSRFGSSGDFAAMTARFAGPPTDELVRPGAAGHVARAVNRHLRGDLEGAAQDLDAALVLEPDHVAALLLRGMARASQKDHDGALADLERAVTLAPTRFEGWAGIGRTRRGKDDLDGAIAAFTKAIELQPGHASLWHWRGEARGRKGQFAEGTADLDRAVALEPDVPTHFSQRGELRMALRDLQGALADYTRVTELLPRSHVGHSGRGAVLGLMKQPQRALEASDRAVALAPNNMTVRLYRAVTRRSTGDLEGALADLELVFREPPTTEQPWYERGLSRAGLRDFDGALGDLQRALELATEQRKPIVQGRIDEVRAVRDR